MDNNSPAYLSTLTEARLLGNNWKTARDNKRKLARSLIVAAMVDNYQLEPLIGEAKASMGFAKLDKPEQAQAKVFFSTLRTIAGAWAGLKPEQRDAFVKGELLFSTLATDIKAADKAAEKAEENAEQAPPVVEGEAPPVVEPVATPGADLILSVADMLDGRELSDAEQAAMALLFDAVAAYQARTVEVALAA